MARLNYKEVLKGDKGTTFTPHVTEEGLLYWKNDGGLINPTPVNIQGKQGEQGEQGEIGRLTEEQEQKIDRVIKDYNDAISNLTNGNENATNSEIVQARNGEVNLNRRLDKFDLKLSENIRRAYENSKQNSVPYNYNGAVITWVDDDAKSGFLTNLKPLLDARNLKCSVAVITSNVGKNDYLTKKDLLLLQDQGFEIVSHSSTHDANIYKNNVVTVSENLIDLDMKTSQEWLIDNGFNGFDKLVFPWGNFGSSSKKYKKIARKYFKYALNAIGSYNKTPVDNMYLDRYFINKTMNLETIKAKIDDAISNDGWLILGSHSYSDEEFDKTLFSSVLDYIISKNVPILRLDEAIRYKGNVISVGEYEENENKFLLSVDGKTNFPIIVKTDTNTYNENSLITDFAKDTTTKFISLNSNSFRVAGIMDVFRSSSLYYSYATFTPFNSNRLYMRKWNDTSSKWDAWEEIGSTINTNYATISTSLNGYTVSTTLENRIGKLDKIINGCVTIENENRNGNLKFNDVIALFDKSFSPKNAMFVKLIIVTDTGEFKEAYASVESTNTNTIIKSQFTLEDNNIKYIVCNFNYCLS